MIKLLLKIPYFRSALVKAAFKIAYVDRDENAILNFVFQDSKGRKYFKYIRPDLLPLQRYEQMDIRLLEIESRIGRETLKLYAKANEEAAKAGDLLGVARLAGELNDRLDILYDPDVMFRFICGLLIREDQIKSAHIWNQEFENQKYNDLIEDFTGRLSFFFQLTSLSDHVSFSSLSGLDLESLMSEPMMQNQMSEVKAFNQMLMKVSEVFSKK